MNAYLFEKRILFYVIALVLCILLCLLFAGKYLLVSLAIGVASAIVFSFLDSFIINSDKLLYLWYSVRYRNNDIRLSVSYLFRIKIDQDYLLISGNRYKQYQPVGGVIKRLPSSTRFFQDIGARDDKCLPIDEKSKDDLRIRIKGKYLLRFLDWFDSKKNREVGVWREFYEELIESELFPDELFPFISCQYLERYYHPIRFSPYAESHEILIAEIYEFLPNFQQEKYLRSIIQDENERLVWVKESQIMKFGTILGENQSIVIAEHAQWLL